MCPNGESGLFLYGEDEVISNCDSVLCLHGRNKAELSNSSSSTSAQLDIDQQAEPSLLFNVTRECKESSVSPGDSGRRAITRRDILSEQYNGIRCFLLYVGRQDIQCLLYTISEQDEYSSDKATTLSISSNTFGATIAPTEEFSELHNMTMMSISSSNFSGCLSSQTPSMALMNADVMHSSSGCINGNLPTYREPSISIYKQFPMMDDATYRQTMHNTLLCKLFDFLRRQLWKIMLAVGKSNLW